MGEPSLEMTCDLQTKSIPNSPEKNCALNPFLDTVLSDLNSMRMLLYWEVMASGFSAPQNLPCSLESAESPLRTST